MEKEISEQLLAAALAYRKLGLSVIATNAEKKSIVPWEIYQISPARESTLRRMFLDYGGAGIAIICGQVSGFLEVIDIDLKHDTTGTLYERFISSIKKKDPSLLEKLSIAKTRSGGYHLIYRCSAVARYTALARRPTTEQERKMHPNAKVKVLIETRSEGGYFLVAPSQGYRFVQGDLSSIAEITPEQRTTIFESARSFNELKSVIQPRTAPPKIKTPGVLTPLDDYNQRGDIIGLLEEHGWTVVRQTRERTYLKRPGDTDKESSGDYNHHMGLFSTFSTSTEFEPCTGYRPYAVYTVLECNGDFKEAVKRLAKEGYGSPPREIQAAQKKKK